VAKTTESDKVIGELRNIQNELKALEETLQNLAEVLFPEKTQNQKISRNRKDKKQKSPTRKQK
jgi:GTPase involved in cell partitioning and DNA repair